jgi:hypothetical protein
MSTIANWAYGEGSERDLDAFCIDEGEELRRETAIRK